MLRLLRAIKAGDLAAVCAEIDAGADPNGVGRYETAPIRAATMRPDAPVREAMTELLLAAGADPNRHLLGYSRPLYAFTSAPHASAARKVAMSTWR